MKNPAAVSLGILGGIARNKSLTPARRSEIAKIAVTAREEYRHKKADKKRRNGRKNKKRTHV